MHSQKKATAAARREWAQAVADGRVLKIGPETLISYPTIEMRDQALARFEADGLPVSIVQR